MGLFQGDLINVLFTNKEPGNLSLNKISMKSCWHNSSSHGDSTAPLSRERRYCHCV
uniref:Uncharacterized protein n=1 Tax=Gallus gallus TaxID=9031 RepID=A0A8V1A686_CHICK